MILLSQRQWSKIGPKFFDICFERWSINFLRNPLFDTLLLNRKQPKKYYITPENKSQKVAHLISLLQISSSVGKPAAILGPALWTGLSARKGRLLPTASKELRPPANSLVTELSQERIFQAYCSPIQSLNYYFMRP